MKKKYIVAGAGFKGFSDALALINAGDCQVTLIEPAPFFGGLMYSREFDGFYIDKGVHMFDSIPVELADVVNEIMEDQTRPIDFVSESAYNGKVTEGYSLPDLNSMDDDSVKQKIKEELIELAKSARPTAEASSLAEWFHRNYGQTGGDIFCDIFSSLYGVAPSEIEASAISQTSMGRMKFLEDDEMRKLKEDPWLETVLAARRKVMGKIDDYVSIYPDSGEGMLGFCERAKTWLEKKGVTICLSEKIQSIENIDGGITVKTDKQELTADKLIWSNDNLTALGAAAGIEDTASSQRHITALVFYTFVTQAEHIKDFTYIQNFEPSHYTYRTSATGIYSGQIKEDGTSFITAECPTVVGSDLWEKADDIVEDVWQEVKSLNVVAPEATLVNSEVLKIPVTFKLPKLGYNDKVAEFQKNLAEKCPDVILRSVVPFYRREIYFDSLTLPKQLEA